MTNAAGNDVAHASPLPETIFSWRHVHDPKALLVADIMYGMGNFTPRACAEQYECSVLIWGLLRIHVKKNKAAVVPDCVRQFACATSISLAGLGDDSQSYDDTKQPQYRIRLRVSLVSRAILQELPMGTM